PTTRRRSTSCACGAHRGGPTRVHASQPQFADYFVTEAHKAVTIALRIGVAAAARPPLGLLAEQALVVVQPLRIVGHDGEGQLALGLLVRELPRVGPQPPVVTHVTAKLVRS